MFQRQPCTVLIEEREFEDGSKQTKFACELQGMDADGFDAASKIVELEGLIPEEVGMLVSGETTVYTPGAELTEEKMVIPNGAMLELKRSPQAETSSGGDDRKLAVVTGDKKVLAVRIVATDSTTTPSFSELSDSIFGTSGDPLNFVSQYKACSYNKLRFAPTSDSRATHGVYQVTVAVNVNGMTDATVRNAVTTQLTTNLGTLSTQFDHVMLCLPPGTSGSWIAYAYVNHWLSVFNDKWCTYPSANMHEIGHNLNLAHSGETSAYDDQVGLVRITCFLSIVA